MFWSLLIFFEICALNTWTPRGLWTYLAILVGEQFKAWRGDLHSYFGSKGLGFEKFGCPWLDFYLRFPSGYFRHFYHQLQSSVSCSKHLHIDICVVMRIWAHSIEKFWCYQSFWSLYEAHIIQFGLIPLSSGLWQAYYPERLGRLFIVHVPKIFWGAWKLVHPFIDKVTRDKVYELHFLILIPSECPQMILKSANMETFCCQEPRICISPDGAVEKFKPTKYLEWNAQITVCYQKYVCFWRVSSCMQ